MGHDSDSGDMFWVRRTFARPFGSCSLTPPGENYPLKIFGELSSYRIGCFAHLPRAQVPWKTRAEQGQNIKKRLVCELANEAFPEELLFCEPEISSFIL